MLSRERWGNSNQETDTIKIIGKDLGDDPQNLDEPSVTCAASQEREGKSSFAVLRDEVPKKLHYGTHWKVFFFVFLLQM